MAGAPPSNSGVDSGAGQTPPAVKARKPRLGIAILAALIVASLALGSVAAAEVSPSPPRESTVFATYDMNQSSQGFVFPDCAVVNVTWVDLSHHQVGFGVWSGAALFVSDCHGPPDSTNSSCPPGWCGPGHGSVDPGPVEWQNATHGGFQFTATQPGYGFSEENPNSSGPSSDPIQFTVSYSALVIPASWTPPALIAFLAVGTITVAFAIALAVRRLTRRR